MTPASRRRGLLVIIASLTLGIGELVALNSFAVRAVTGTQFIANQTDKP